MTITFALAKVSFLRGVVTRPQAVESQNTGLLHLHGSTRLSHATAPVFHVICDGIAFGMIIHASEMIQPQPQVEK